MEVKFSHQVTTPGSELDSRFQDIFFDLLTIMTVHGAVPLPPR